MGVKERILTLTKELIKIESVSSDLEKQHEIMDFVEDYVKKNVKKEYFLERFEFEWTPSMVVKNFDWRKADIVMCGHLDVVAPSENWQFAPYEKDWKLYGRWSWDMKSGCAVIIELMIEFLNKSFDDKKVILMLTSDEEIWWDKWVGKLVELGYVWDVTLIPDWGSTCEIICKEKWVYMIEFEMYWKSCHSSRPWTWEDAIRKTINFYDELKSIVESNDVIYWGKNNRWGTSVVMTKMSWWKSMNTLCDFVKAHIDIRYTEETSIKELDKITDKLLKKYSWKRTLSLNANLLYTDEENKYIKRYKKVCEQNMWTDVKLWLGHGASDWRYFWDKWSAVFIHKAQSFQEHSKWECVVIDDLEKIYSSYKEFIEWWEDEKYNKLRKIGVFDNVKKLKSLTWNEVIKKAGDNIKLIWYWGLLNIDTHKWDYNSKPVVFYGFKRVYNLQLLGDRDNESFVNFLNLYMSRYWVVESEEFETMRKNNICAMNCVFTWDRNDVVNGLLLTIPKENLEHHMIRDGYYNLVEVDYDYVSGETWELTKSGEKAYIVVAKEDRITDKWVPLKWYQVRWRESSYSFWKYFWELFDKNVYDTEGNLVKI